MSDKLYFIVEPGSDDTAMLFEDAPRMRDYLRDAAVDEDLSEWKIYEVDAKKCKRPQVTIMVDVK